MQMASSLEPGELARIHSGLEKVVEVSALLDFPFTLGEVASYFLPGFNITERQLRSLLAKADFIDIPFRIENGFILPRALVLFKKPTDILLKLAVPKQTMSPKLSKCVVMSEVVARLPR